jgi:hypothetical protein
LQQTRQQGRWSRQSFVWAPDPEPDRVVSDSFGVAVDTLAAPGALGDQQPRRSIQSEPKAEDDEKVEWDAAAASIESLEGRSTWVSEG